MDEQTTTAVKAGSVVRLRSGGPWMTVEATSGDTANCVWLDSKQAQKRGSFFIVTLENQNDWAPVV